MFFFVKAKNPRPTFHLDMTPHESSVMAQHVAYWTALAERGVAVAFGPVMDPAGVFGVGIHEVDDEETLRELLAHDPAGALLTYEVYPMPRVIVGRRS